MCFPQSTYHIIDFWHCRCRFLKDPLNEPVEGHLDGTNNDLNGTGIFELKLRSIRAFHRGGFREGVRTTPEMTSGFLK